MASSQHKNVLGPNDVKRALARMAHEIVERNRENESITIVGIETRGAYLARRLSNNIGNFEGFFPTVGTLDPRLHRDDPVLASDQPVKPAQMSVPIDGMRVVLVDDVLYTGRTVRAALEALMDFGRASQVQLAVLIDRGHRELPIRPDYTGKNVPTGQNERVHVKISEIDGEDRVDIVASNTVRLQGD